MAYFSSIWKARIIEQCRQEYENEKINSILASKTELPRKTMMQKWRFYGHNTKRRFKGRLRKLFPDGSSVSNLYFYLKSDHAFPNLFIKSAIGFVGGIALTYLCFIFFVYQLSISYPHATIMSSIIGVLLTLGLAFSWRIRCLVFLLIPQMFSRVGRYTLTCYALVLILTGPATNTLRNSEVLTESMACSQEQIKTNVRQINESVKKPFNALKRPIKLIMDRMKRVTSEINRLVSRISAVVTNIGDFIQSSFAWLNRIAGICTKKFGSPHDRCRSAILQGVSNCKKRLGPNMPQLYSETEFAETVCRHVGSGTECVVADYATASYSATLRRKLRNFVARMKTTLYTDIDIHHTHMFSHNNTAHSSPIAAGLVTDIRKKADPLLTWLSWSSCVTSLCLLLIIFRAKYYQHMFETRSRFDNRYVTKELRELDLKRYRERRETVLPLNKREQAKYICTTSFNLVASEKVYLSRSMVFMAITTFKLLIHMVADYSLYWVLITIRYQGNTKRPLQPSHPDIGIQVTGTGIVANFIRSLIDSIILPLLPRTPSPTTCLPKPHPPDLQRYMHIGILIILLWFFAVFEPYGLRLRHIIMGHYQPERAKARALWLFNHILRTRGSFMKLARRKLHREYKYSDQEHLTFRYWINSVVPCSCFKHMFGITRKTKHCLLCNTFEELNDTDTELTSCETLKCPGVYCVRCFSDIGRLCTICLTPAQYGDISDVSLEKGSSDSGSDEEDDETHDSFYKKKSENECLIKKSTVKKDKHRDSSYSNNSCGKVRESTLSLINHHELDRSSNRPTVNLSYRSLTDSDDNAKHRDQYGFKQIRRNVQSNVYNLQYELQNTDLPNGTQLSKFDNAINMTFNKLAKRNKVCKLAKFLVRKKVKMKDKRRVSRDLAFKEFLQLVYKRIVPLEKYAKILRTKSIKICTIQKKKCLRKRSHIKLIFKRKPYSIIKTEKLCKVSRVTSKCCVDTDNKALHVNYNNIYNENNSLKGKYTRKRVKKAKYRNITGYKINKIKTFYKLCYCKPEKLTRKPRNKTNFKRRKKRAPTKNIVRQTENNKIIHNYGILTTSVDPDRNKERIFLKESYTESNLRTLPKTQAKKRKAEMESQNNINIDTCGEKNFKNQYNLDHYSKKKSYRTFGKNKDKPIKTSLPLMKEVCIWLASVLSIRRYTGISKQINTAEKGAMALPRVSSRSCQCNEESLDLSYDINQNDELRKPLHKSCKELDHRYNKCESTSEKISSSKYSLSDTKTNTTVCSWFVMDQYVRRNAYDRNLDSNIKKETNKDVFTDRSKLCDVSTSTNDWWSPLEERRVFNNNSKGKDK